MMTKDKPGVWANGRGRAGGGGALGWVCTTLVWPGQISRLKRVWFLGVLSVQFYYLASLTGFVLGTEEYDGCR